MISTPQFVRTLADGTRLRIVNLLARGSLCVCDIQYILDQPQSSVSRHLAHLRLVGLVHDRRDGMRTFYELTDWDAGVPRGVLETLRRELQAELDYRRDLEMLADMKATKQYHQEGSEGAPRPGSGRRRARLRSNARAVSAASMRTRPGTPRVARAQR